MTLPNPTQPIETAQTLACQFATRATQADKLGQLPAEDVSALKASGYLAFTIPTAYGGLGLSLRDTVAAHLELAQGSTSTALVAAMQLHVFGSAREQNPWTEDGYARLCEIGVQHSLINSVASEPEMGSPSRGGLPATAAHPTDNGQGWRINGHKTWITGGEHLTHLLVRTRLNDQSVVFIIQQGTAGLRWEHTWRDALSLRASDSHDLYLEDVEVPLNHLITPTNGVQPTKKIPNAWFPMLMATTYLGAAFASRHAVIRYALERVPSALGRPISTLPKIQRQIGEIDMQLQAARALLFEATSQWTGQLEQSAAQYPKIVAAKSFVVEVANQVTDQALRIAGGTSVTNALPLERYFRDVRAGMMQPPSGDTAMELIGRHALERAA